MIRLLPEYSKSYNKAFLVAATLALTIPLLFHHRHDYGAYVVQWKVTLAGGNPWLYDHGGMTGNSYGPLFNLFSYLYSIHPHLPHLIFISVWLMMSVFLLRKMGSIPQISDSEKKFLYWFLILNPFFWIEIVSYGHFDILVAGCILFSIIFLNQKREVLAGMILGIGFLLKYIPIIVFPFLALSQEKIHFKFIFTWAAVCILGLGLSYYFWGDSILFPFVFTRDRPSNFLSIYRFFRGPYSPIGNLDRFSLWPMAGAWVVLVILHFKYRVECILAASVALYAVLLLSKLGHPQFYTPLFFLVPYWWLNERSKEKQKLIIPLSVPLLSLTMVNLIYVATQGFKNGWEWIDHIISLPFFSIGMICFIWIVKDLFRVSIRE